MADQDSLAIGHKDPPLGRTVGRRICNERGLREPEDEQDDQDDRDDGAADVDAVA